MTDDLPDDSPPPCCPSCGVPYVDHLGLHGVCAEVQQLCAEVEHYRTRDSAHEFAALARIAVAERERDGLHYEVMRLRAALAEVLGWMTQAGYVGENCLRSRWVSTSHVEELRRLVEVRP